MTKIDFIITWVDENDSAWLKEKERYSAEGAADDREIRYRDYELLKYWFRGVEQNTPWVNKIHFVTYGHLPEWLDVNHPKLNIVNHEDFIPEKYLPTYNSRVIELYFHKIKNISEQFVYFNDDMYIIDEVNPTHFFKNNLPRDTFHLSVFRPRRTNYFASLNNTMSIVNEHFDKNKVISANKFKVFNYRYRFDKNIRSLISSLFSRFSLIEVLHIPTPYLKSTYEKVWQIEKNELEKTSSFKFRDPSNTSHTLFRYWQLLTGKFHPIRPLGSLYTLGNNDDIIFNAIRGQKEKVVCVNDSESVDNFEQTKNELINSFASILPDKSSFEL